MRASRATGQRWRCVAVPVHVRGGRRGRPAPRDPAPEPRERRRPTTDDRGERAPGRAPRPQETLNAPFSLPPTAATNGRGTPETRTSPCAFRPASRCSPPPTARCSATAGASASTPRSASTRSSRRRVPSWRRPTCGTRSFPPTCASSCSASRWRGACSRAAPTTPARGSCATSASPSARRRPARRPRKGKARGARAAVAASARASPPPRWCSPRPSSSRCPRARGKTRRASARASA